MSSTRMAGSRLPLATIWRLIACAALLCALSLAFTPSRAHAFCSGLGCLPGTGYTIDRTWDCGQIHSETLCWFNGVTSRASATQHTWGFGSAAYNGEGSVSVAIEATTGTIDPFGSSGTNLARACFENNCNDQESTSLYENVSNSGFHTIFGHGEA